jgi:hypothetical protein
MCTRISIEDIKKAGNIQNGEATVTFWEPAKAERKSW